MHCKNCIYVYRRSKEKFHKYYFQPVWWKCQITDKEFHPNDPYYDKESFEPDDERICDCNDKRVAKLKADLESIEMHLKAIQSNKARYEAQLEDGR